MFQRLKTLLTHRTIFLFGLLFVLTGILAVSTFFHPQILVQGSKRFNTVWENILNGEIFKEKSTAKIWTEKNSVMFQFNIAKDDIESIKQFNQKLGANDSYLKGMSFEIDEASRQKLADFLPLNATLKITPQSLSFKSGMQSGFASSLIKDKQEFSTGSGKLILVKSSGTEFQIEMTDPAPLLKYATESGQFVFSDKLQPLFPILERVGTIEMSVNGKSVSGEVKLK